MAVWDVRIYQVFTKCCIFLANCYVICTNVHISWDLLNIFLNSAKHEEKKLRHLKIFDPLCSHTVYFTLDLLVRLKEIEDDLLLGTDPIFLKIRNSQTVNNIAVGCKIVNFVPRFIVRLSVWQSIKERNSLPELLYAFSTASKKRIQSDLFSCSRNSV